MPQNIYESQTQASDNFNSKNQKFKSKQDKEEYSENNLETDYLFDFCSDLLKDFRVRDYKNLNEEQKRILSHFPNDLEKILKVIEEIQKQEKKDRQEELQDDLDTTKDNSYKNKRTVKREQRKNERQAKLKEVSGELFIASCASSKSVEESLKFHKKCNLGVEELNKFNKNAVNPLVALMASGKDSKELDKFLKTAGVDINHKDKNGNTILHMAASIGLDKNAFEVLIKNGANINAKNDFGMTALDVAAIKGDEKVAEFLLQKGGKSGIAEKNSDFLEENQNEDSKSQKDHKMQNMLRKSKEQTQESGEKEGKQRQVKKEGSKESKEIENKEREKLRQEKIRQERAKQEEIRARMNAEVELAFKMHQERMLKISRENSVKKEAILQKETLEKYDREFLEKQNAEITRYNLEKLEYEKKFQETYSQDKFLKDEQNISKQEIRENYVEEINLLVNKAKIDNTLHSLLEQNNLDSYNSLLANSFIQIYSQLKESVNQEIKTEEPKQFSQIEEILGVKLSEITPETINKMLFEAVRKNQYILSNILIICGADVNHREGGTTVLEVAELSGNKSLVTTILNKVNETVVFQNNNPISSDVENLKKNSGFGEGVVVDGVVLSGVVDAVSRGKYYEEV
ncbi:MAG: hypothetical protein FJ368_06845, partial [Pelagibacterales bacterium]|nr:hypothetical protein [Pelagibacterales bacterium]